MADTRFSDAQLVSTRPWGVYVQVGNNASIRLAQNALAQRLPLGSQLLVAEKDGKLTVIGRRLPEVR